MRWTSGCVRTANRKTCVVATVTPVTQQPRARLDPNYSEDSNAALGPEKVRSIVETSSEMAGKLRAHLFGSFPREPIIELSATRNTITQTAICLFRYTLAANRPKQCQTMSLYLIRRVFLKRCRPVKSVNVVHNDSERDNGIVQMSDAYSGTPAAMESLPRSTFPFSSATLSAHPSPRK